MGAWGETALYIYDPYQDPRTTVITPIFTELQKRRFAKLSLPEDPGRAAFNKVFEGNEKANPLGAAPIITFPNVPCFGWMK